MSDLNNVKMVLNDVDITNNSEEDIQEMLDEFIEKDYYNGDENDMSYFLCKSNYVNDELFYEKEYTVKELLKICNYYGLDKDIKLMKCKKADIIATLVYFESLPENADIVMKRNRMWAYITELLNDKIMKKYIIF